MGAACRRSVPLREPRATCSSFQSIWSCVAEKSAEPACVAPLLLEAPVPQGVGGASAGRIVLVWPQSERSERGSNIHLDFQVPPAPSVVADVREAFRALA